jgi:transposase-like protein
VSVSEKTGCVEQMLNEWVKKAEVVSGKRAVVTTDMSEGVKALERGNRGLQQVGEILCV